MEHEVENPPTCTTTMDEGGSVFTVDANVPVIYQMLKAQVQNLLDHMDSNQIQKVPDLSSLKIL